MAKRPPSSGTSGRRSGGITGITSSIIHSGLLSDSLKASTTLRRFAIFFRLASEVVAFISARSSSARTCTSRKPFFSGPLRSSRMASAPMPAWR